MTEMPNVCFGGKIHIYSMYHRLSYQLTEGALTEMNHCTTAMNKSAMCNDHRNYSVYLDGYIEE